MVIDDNSSAAPPDRLTGDIGPAGGFGLSGIQARLYGQTVFTPFPAKAGRFHPAKHST